MKALQHTKAVRTIDCVTALEMSDVYAGQIYHDRSGCIVNQALLNLARRIQSGARIEPCGYELNLKTMRVEQTRRPARKSRRSLPSKKAKLA